MCHGMGLTASAVGERITLVWSLTEPQWGLNLTSLSRWQWSWLLPSPDLLRQAVAPQQRQPPQWQWSWLLHSLDLLRQAVAPQQRQPPQQWEWSLRLHCSGSSR